MFLTKIAFIVKNLTMYGRYFGQFPRSFALLPNK